MGLLMALLLWGHANATANLPNSTAGMFVFHGSAALLDAMLLLVNPALLGGRLCDDMEVLLMASIIANALGWALYLAYAPPILYNAFMWALSVVQWLRLLYVDRHDANRLGFNLVRGRNYHGAHFHTTAP